MKKFIIAVIMGTVVGLAGGYIIVKNHQTDASVRKVVQNSFDATSTPVPRPDLPQTLVIPSLNISAAVESVGLDKNGLMDIPSNFVNTAWYNLGPRPGETGNAVIDGHVDTPAGAPSVFWNIKNMQQGDEIDVVDVSGKKYRFKVTAVTSYRFDAFPVNTVFGTYPKARLNLITCGGAWDRTTQNYSERVVVFSEIAD